VVAMECGEVGIHVGPSAHAVEDAAAVGRELEVVHLGPDRQRDRYARGEPAALDRRSVELPAMTGTLLREEHGAAVRADLARGARRRIAEGERRQVSVERSAKDARE